MMKFISSKLMGGETVFQFKPFAASNKGALLFSSYQFATDDGTIIDVTVPCPSYHAAQVSIFVSFIYNHLRVQNNTPVNSDPRSLSYQSATMGYTLDIAFHNKHTVYRRTGSSCLVLCRLRANRTCHEADKGTFLHSQVDNSGIFRVTEQSGSFNGSVGVFIDMQSRNGIALSVEDTREGVFFICTDGGIPYRFLTHVYVSLQYHLLVCYSFIRSVTEGYQVLYTRNAERGTSAVFYGREVCPSLSSVPSYLGFSERRFLIGVDGSVGDMKCNVVLLRFG